jgi:methyl-accepting chemotaxis protein
MAQEASAVALSMTQQAKVLTDLISVFRVHGDRGARSVRPAIAPAAVARAVSAALAQSAPVQRVAGSEVQWQEF